MSNRPSDPWIERFVEHLRYERRLSPHTLSNYTRDLKAFDAWRRDQDVAEWSRLDSHHIRAFAAHQHRKGYSPRSIQRRLSAVRSFFNFLLREGAIGANPAVDIRAPKARHRLPDALDTDRMAALLAFEPEDTVGFRDLAMMELLYSSGLRLAELVSLDLEALDLSDRTVRVTGKGDKTRLVPVGARAQAALTDWLKVRGELAAQDTHAVFVGVRGGRISPRTVQARVAHWARRQGIDARVYPHLFRHSFATHVLESSQDLRGVQELLGHADISTTQVYTHLDFQHLARIYDEAHPRARQKRSRRTNKEKT